ncbi:MAG: phosphatidylglycerophosphatase A [Sideroxyarcus sp.]|nr:phosphatidylglycerophosphatase A [Sideroxyarcus sp.]
MIIRPTLRFVLAHPAHFLALGFGTGLAPVAPGTVGTLLGFPIYGLLASRLAPAELLAGVAGMFAIGVWACGKTGTDLGIADHSAMNWDEVVAFILILAITPPGWAWQAFAFFAFRFFDVVKPPPIRYFDRTIKGGFGVMFDDIVAAGYVLLCLAIIKTVLT